MRIVSALLVSGLLMLSGCASMGGNGGGNGGWNPPPIEDLAPSIERFTELTAVIAFSNDIAKEYKEPICMAVGHVAGVLDNFEDADATFDSLREAALAAIRDIDHPSFTDQARQIALLVTDQILDVVFTHVRTRYDDLVNSDETRVALVVGRAVSTGLNNACLSTQSLRNFSVEAD